MQFMKFKVKNKKKQKFFFYKNVIRFKVIFENLI